jgi:hypothetical protein
MEPQPTEVRAWLAKLPAAEKDDLLTRLVADNDGVLGYELAQRMRREREGDGAGEAMVQRRTVAELLRLGEQAADERKRIAAAKAAKEKEERECAAAVARAKHLDELAGREPKLWHKVEHLIATKQPKSYDHAVELLVDLRDLASRKDGADFRRRIEALRTAHVRKPTLIDRLYKAGL